MLKVKGAAGGGSLVLENPVTENAAPDLHGLKVLVIDDSKTIRRTAETLLSKEGCTVYTAVDGFDALSKIADYRPDVIFVEKGFPMSVQEQLKLMGYKIVQRESIGRTEVIKITAPGNVEAVGDKRGDDSAEGY